jgi:hypothetical protein
MTSAELELGIALAERLDRLDGRLVEMITLLREIRDQPEKRAAREKTVGPYLDDGGVTIGPILPRHAREGNGE